MKVGLVSDLHRQLPTAVMEALQGVDRILCAGDIEVEPILWELQTIAPVTAVKGNNDYGIDLPLSTTFTLEGVRFFMVHRPQRSYWWCSLHQSREPFVSTRRKRP